MVTKAERNFQSAQTIRAAIGTKSTIFMARHTVERYRQQRPLSPTTGRHRPDLPLSYNNRVVIPPSWRRTSSLGSFIS